jgi:hypothetical protein
MNLRNLFHVVTANSGKNLRVVTANSGKTSALSTQTRGNKNLRVVTANSGKTSALSPSPPTQVKHPRCHFHRQLGVKKKTSAFSPPTQVKNFRVVTANSGKTSALSPSPPTQVKKNVTPFLWLATSFSFV